MKFSLTLAFSAALLSSGLWAAYEEVPVVKQEPRPQFVDSRDDAVRVRTHYHTRQIVVDSCPSCNNPCAYQTHTHPVTNYLNKREAERRCCTAVSYDELLNTSWAGGTGCSACQEFVR